MKFAVKTLVLGICLAGASAAFANHKNAAPPIPSCDPGVKCAMNALPPIPSCDPGVKCTADLQPPIPSCDPGVQCAR
jgi:hypothetical protein